MDKLLEGLLVKAYDKSPEEISELLYQKSDDSEEVTLREDAIDLVLDLDEQRVSKIKSSVKPDKEKLKEIRDQNIKEIMEDFERKLKARYNIESSSKGLDLVQEIIDQVSDCDISEDKIKQHPTYLELEQRKIQEVEDLQQEYEDYKLNQDKRTRLDRVRQDVLGIFATLNPIESETTAVANTRREDFLRKFDNYDYEIQENGDHFVKQDGKRVEDRHGNPIKFQDHVKDIASRNYDFAQSSGGNAGNQGSGNGSGSRTDIPKDEKEYLAKMADLLAKNDKEGVVKLNEAWKMSQKS